MLDRRRLADRLVAAGGLRRGLEARLDRLRLALHRAARFDVRRTDRVFERLRWQGLTRAAGGAFRRGASAVLWATGFRALAEQRTKGLVTLAPGGFPALLRGNDQWAMLAPLADGVTP